MVLRPRTVPLGDQVLAWSRAIQQRLRCVGFSVVHTFLLKSNNPALSLYAFLWHVGSCSSGGGQRVHQGERRDCAMLISATQPHNAIRFVPPHDGWLFAAPQSTIDTLFNASICTHQNCKYVHCTRTQSISKSSKGASKVVRYLPNLKRKGKELLVHAHAVGC